MHLRHIQVRTRSVLSGIPTRSVGTISVISSTPIMPMLVLSVIPESCCDHGVCIQSDTFVLAPFCASFGLVYNDERSAW